MPAAYKLVSGTNGQVKALTAATDGPLGATVVPVAVAELAKWSMPMKVNPLKTYNFGGPVDAYGNLWPLVYVGNAEGQIAVEGQYDITLATNSGIKIIIGKYYYLDLIISRTQPFGYKNVYALCVDFVPDVNVENQVSKFTAASPKR
jgi:hypothetical protein